MTRYLAEFIGTFGLVFAGCGAIVIDAVSDGQVTHVGIGLTFGLIVAAMIYATGHISGAHLNPAVSLAFAATRHFPLRHLAPYWIAQLTGAVAAGASLRLLFGPIASLGATIPRGSVWQALRPGRSRDRTNVSSTRWPPAHAHPLAPRPRPVLGSVGNGHLPASRPKALRREARQSQWRIGP